MARSHRSPDQPIVRRDLEDFGEYHAPSECFGFFLGLVVIIALCKLILAFEGGP